MKIKKFVSLILCIAIVVSVFSFSIMQVNSASITNSPSARPWNEYTSKDGNWKYTDTGEGFIYLSEYLGKKKQNITLPTEIDGNKINGVCLWENKNLVNVKVPKEYTWIISQAFESCKNLKSVEFSREYTDNDNVIFENAVFENCKNLEKVILPNKIDSDGQGTPNCLPDATFHKCPNLKTVVLPENLISVESAAFKGCNSIETIDLPEGIKIIESGAFNDCDSLKHLRLPSTLEEINDRSLPYLPNCTIEVNKDNEAFNDYIEDNDTKTTAPKSSDWQILYVPEQIPEDEWTPGDVNGDGKFNILDVTYLQKYLCGFFFTKPQGADYNDDGKVNINDCTKMQRVLAQMI